MSSDTVQDIYTFWRYVSFILSVFAFGLTALRAIKLWKYLDIQSKLGFLACISFCLAFIWGILEVLIYDIPAGPRSIVAVLPLFWLTLAGLLPMPPVRLDAMREGSKNAKGNSKAKD